MEQKDYQRWLSGAGGDKPMRTSGEQLFISSNCMSCHGTWAPTMAGLYMSNVKLADGRTVVADAAYIRTMILDPGAHIVDGYQANSTVLMPTFRGSLTEEQIGEIIEYIKSLASAASFGPAAQPVPSGGSNTEMRKPGFGGPPPNSRDPLQPVE
jgi:cytochrome c oxidase subunit 2